MGRAKYVNEEGFVVGSDGIGSVTDFAWVFARDPWGQPFVCGADGLDPLRHPDPLIRLRAVCLTVAVPGLLNWTLASLNRLRATTASYAPDRQLWEDGWWKVLGAKPLVADVDRLIGERGQCHLDLRDRAA